jgi:hypothetical protein
VSQKMVSIKICVRNRGSRVRRRRPVREISIVLRIAEDSLNDLIRLVICALTSFSTVWTPGQIGAAHMSANTVDFCLSD